jgi:hypothetical protein
MKTIVAGSREITDYQLVWDAVYACPWVITEIVSGGARGVDQLGEKVATAFGIPIKIFPANWDLHKRAAGPIRNQQMAEYADALLAIWDGSSTGTADMIRRAKQMKLQVHVVKILPPWDDMDEFGF